MQVIAYGIDYVRFKVSNQQDIEYLGRTFRYINIQTVWFHGSQFVDITGSALEVIRIFDDIEELIAIVARTLQVHRLDVYIDVAGNLLPDITKPGTVIMNGGNIETVYSHNLKNRGDYPAFGRVYDAQKAGHYDVGVTRFEIEMKRELCKGIIDCDAGWVVNPVGVALWYIGDLFKTSITIPHLEAIEFKGARKRLAHSRERFYMRYGKNILLDFETMGARNLERFILNCIIAKRDKEKQ